MLKEDAMGWGGMSVREQEGGTVLVGGKKGGRDNVIIVLFN